MSHPKHTHNDYTEDLYIFFSLSLTRFFLGDPCFHLVKSSSPLLSARPLLRSHFLLDVGEAKREPGSKRRARAQRAETHTQHRLDVVPVIESILYYGCVYVFKTQIIGDSWMENQIGSKPSKFFFLAATHNSRRADTNSLFFLHFFDSTAFILCRSSFSRALFFVK
jgi:hypothetical protein